MCGERQSTPPFRTSQLQLEDTVWVSAAARANEKNSWVIFKWDKFGKHTRVKLCERGRGPSSWGVPLRMGAPEGPEEVRYGAAFKGQATRDTDQRRARGQ